MPLNVIAGLLIGGLSATWGQCLTNPFLWGAVFCLGQSMFGWSKGHYTASFEHSGDTPQQARRKYYVVEYVTAVVTALPCAVLVRFVILALT